jgi:hypothetical protein
MKRKRPGRKERQQQRCEIATPEQIMIVRRNIARFKAEQKAKQNKSR